MRRLVTALIPAVSVALTACVGTLPGSSPDESTDAAAAGSGGSTGGSTGGTGAATGGAGPAMGGAGGTPATREGELFVPGPGAPMNLAVDSTYLYWARQIPNDTGGFALMKAPLHGAGPPVRIAPLTTSGVWVAVEEPNVYFAQDGYAGQSSFIYQVGLNGVPAMIASEGMDRIAKFAVRHGTVYWADGWGNLKKAAAMAGATPTMLATGFGYPQSMTVDDRNVYWVSDGHIMKVGIAGGQSTELAYSSTGADSLAVDGSHLYWIRGNDNAVMQVGIDGGAVEAVNAPTNTDQYVSSVAIDASVLYWADSLGAVFARTPADGVRVVVPRGGAGPARGLVFDATDAYWIAGDQIYRAPK